jgi:hypothetical protein
MLMSTQTNVSPRRKGNARRVSMLVVSIWTDPTYPASLANGRAEIVSMR